MTLARITGSPIPRELGLLRSVEYSSPSEINRLHEERLIQLLRHAWENTDYYRVVLGDCGVVRENTVDLDCFHKIPFLTKEVIRREGPRLRAKNLPKGRKPYVNRTGGSTGEPVEYWQDSYYWDNNVATKIYHFEVLGKQLGESELKVWGSDRDIFQETGSWTAIIKNFLYNRRIRTCSRLSDTDMKAIVDEINRFRPKSIWGYIDGAYMIADYVNRSGVAVHSPVAVFGGGGTLFPHMSEAIKRAFHAPAVNIYGSREMGEIACECAELAGLHICTLSHRVEVIDGNAMPVIDQEGDLIVTSLHNYTMPFIRYRIGDRGRLTDRSCRCGRGFPLLDSLTGRSMESFVTADGAVVSPIYLITSVGTAFEPEMVKKFQIVQEDYSRVTLKIVLRAGVAQDKIERDIDAVSAKICGVMGQDCRVVPEFVEDIPPTQSGKYLYTVCKLQTPGYSSVRTN
jgi:phenylacetate-CoA ligase